MTCPRCEKRGKTWKGEDPKCAFKAGGFDSDNWNCATMNELRGKFDDNQIWHEDQKGLITKAFNGGEFLVLSWYKRRGRVEGAWIMDEDKMTSLTLAEAEKILEDGEAIEKNRPEIDFDEASVYDGQMRYLGKKGDFLNLINSDDQDVNRDSKLSKSTGLHPKKPTENP